MKNSTVFTSLGIKGKPCNRDTCSGDNCLRGKLPYFGGISLPIVPLGQEVKENLQNEIQASQKMGFNNSLLFAKLKEECWF